MARDLKPMSREQARSELRRVGLNPSVRKMDLLAANVAEDETILEGVEGAAACPGYFGSAMVVLTNRRVVVVCEPNWVDGLATAPYVEQLPWREIAEVEAQPYGILKLFRSGSSDPVALTFEVGPKNAEPFRQFAARIRNTAEAARSARSATPNGELQVGELERLVELHRSGALTAEEFQAAKAKLLGL
jgi:hypothetical protein